MPCFEDGTRIWIADSRGRPLSEWKEDVTEDKKLGAHTRTVYIPAEKGAFKVCYKMAKPPSVKGKRDQKPKSPKAGSSKPKPPSEAMCQVDVWIDGQHARRVNHTSLGKERFIEGWYSNATTLEKFAFGDIDVNEDIGAESSAQLDNCCIEVGFTDAEMDGYVEPVPCYDVISLARAVHPDSKVASLVGMQVKNAGSRRLSAAQQSSGFRLKPKAGATKYLARFVYLPPQLLVALSIMPEALDPALDHRKRKRGDAASEVEEDEGVEPRKKRLRVDALAAGEQLGEQADQDGSSSVKNKAKRNARSPVKKEASRSAIDLIDSPRRRKKMSLSANLED